MLPIETPLPHWDQHYAEGDELLIDGLGPVVAEQEAAGCNGCVACDDMEACFLLPHHCSEDRIIWVRRMG